MPTKYALLENNIASDPDDHAAMVEISGGADGDDLAQDIIDRAGHPEHGEPCGIPDLRLSRYRSLLPWSRQL